MADARQPFATVEQLAAVWRTLTDTEQTRATALLGAASDRLRGLAGVNGVDLDAKIAEDDIFKINLQNTVLDAVKRAMQAPADLPPVEQHQQAAGPYSQSIKYANPTGDLYFKKPELALIGIGAGQKLTSISSTRRDIYGNQSI